MNASILLSKEFFEFSSKIKDLYLEKTKLNDEFKIVYAEYKSKLRSIDDESLALQSEMCNKNKTAKKDLSKKPKQLV
jgi:hypothetical protein